MLDGVTLVLIQHPAQTAHLARWVQALATDPRLSRVATVLAHPSTLAPQAVATAPAHWRRLELAAPQDPAATLTQVLAEVHTDCFTLLSLTDLASDSVARIGAAVAARIGQGRKVAPHLPVPVLLANHATPVELATAYLDLLPATDAPDVADYRGHLALRSARVTVEWLDPREDAVDVAVRLNLAGHRFAERPQWRFRVTLTTAAGPQASSAPARLRERVDATGTPHWEWLVAHVPLTAVRADDHVLELELVTERASWRLSRTLRPSVGALIGARTVHLTPSSSAPVRYLLHTPAHGREARLRIGRGGGRPADLRWTMGLVGADLRYVARGEGGRRMRLLRLVRLLTVPLVAGRHVWLIGERADEAQDNGLQLFRYLRTHHPRRHAYYVLDRSSPGFVQARRLGHVVAHSSLRHQLLMLHAEVVANAHSMHHLLPRTWPRQAFIRRLAWRVGALQVFLQHGVHLSPEAVKRGGSGYDVILTSTHRESAALRAVSGYDEQIAEVGLPRFDHLTPTARSRTILVMPTWRRYLPSKLFGSDRPGIDPFAGSSYERFFTGLLTSCRLHALLETHDYRLTFLPHTNVAAQFTEARTAGPRIAVAAVAHAPVQELVRRCDAFVTDYSSAHFDAAYLGTPVIYAQFDREEYHARHAAPSWFDAEQDGFGPVTTTLEDTVDALAALLERGCRPDPAYAERVTRLFTHHDRDNSRRVVATIDARLHAWNSARRAGKEPV